MQLPRGTFREIKKAELISSILDELERTKFSGICSISSDPVSGALVFKSGKCILAKIQQKSGDGAWDELRKMSGHKVDAALSSLDEAQIQLALEFNKPFRIIKAEKTAPESAVHHEPAGKPIAHARTAAPVASPTPTPRSSSSFTAPPAAAPSKPVAPPSTARTAAPLPPAVQVKPAAQSPAQPLSAQKPAAPAYATPQIPVHHPPEPKKPAETEESPQDSSSFEKDIDTFDTLDIDNVTDKIRNDCKTMIKQLQLEHLMER